MAQFCLHYQHLTHRCFYYDCTQSLARFYPRAALSLLESGTLLQKTLAVMTIHFTQIYDCSYVGQIDQKQRDLFVVCLREPVVVVAR